jgi:hypothetical protein
MISCPKCSATLPDWAQTCQFCQTDVQKVVRPKPEVPQRRTLAMATTPQWVWGAYYGISVLFILQGGFEILNTILGSHRKFLGQEAGLGFFEYIVIAIGAFNAILGVGLLARVELARGIVNVFCGIRILFGLLGLLGSLGGSLLAGAAALPFILLNIVEIATAGFMIFLIGETDKGAPNL